MYFERLGDITLLTNMILRQKLYVPLLLLRSHRTSTLFMFAVNNMTLNDMSVAFLPNKAPKDSGMCRSQLKVEYKTNKDKKLCVIACHRDFISRWNVVVELDSKQIINTTNRGASIGTMQRFLKGFFADKNIVCFSPHRCWAESTSKANTINNQH